MPAPNGYPAGAWSDGILISLIKTIAGGTAGSSAQAGAPNTANGTYTEIAGSKVLGASANVTIPAGSHAFSVNVISGTAALSGTGMEFDTANHPTGAYNWGGPSGSFKFPAITVTTQGASSATVIWNRF